MRSLTVGNGKRHNAEVSKLDRTAGGDDAGAGGVASALSNLPLFRELEGDAVADLAARGAVRAYEAGAPIFHRDDPPGEVYVLIAGALQVSRPSIKGAQFLATLEAPAFFGELGVLGEMGRTATVRADTDATVWAIGGEEFLAFLDARPALRRELLRSLAHEVQARAALAEELMFLDLKGRVARRLLSLSREAGDGARAISITQSRLADLAGGSREEVSRIVGELQRRGVVERDGRRYELKDLDVLRRLAAL